MIYTGWREGSSTEEGHTDVDGGTNLSLGNDWHEGAVGSRGEWVLVVTQEPDWVSVTDWEFNKGLPRPTTCLSCDHRRKIQGTVSTSLSKKGDWGLVGRGKDTQVSGEKCFCWENSERNHNWQLNSSTHMHTLTTGSKLQRLPTVSWSRGTHLLSLKFLLPQSKCQDFSYRQTFLWTTPNLQT